MTVSGALYMWRGGRVSTFHLSDDWVWYGELESQLSRDSELKYCSGPEYCYVSLGLQGYTNWTTMSVSFDSALAGWSIWLIGWQVICRLLFMGIHIIGTGAYALYAVSIHCSL